MAVFARSRYLPITILALWLQAAAGWLAHGAVAATPQQGESGSQLSDELLLFADLPTVISASRHAQPINLSAVPVDILGSEMIHYSGATNVAELLQFTPGVDVLRVDRNRYIVGVHGLHHQQTDRTLVLINGRNAMSPVYGSTNWIDLPLIIEDIERIEVVRGPGGAAWGANALNGVINIITKDPIDTLGVLASSTVNEYGDTYNQLRWGAESGQWLWRISGAYANHQSSEDAINHDNFTSTDFNRHSIFDGEAHYHATTDSQWRFGLAAVHEDWGPYEYLSVYPSEDSRREEARYFIRLEHDIDSDQSTYLQWSGRYQDMDESTLWRHMVVENDLEGQYQFHPGQEHTMTVGGNLRAVYVDQSEIIPSDLVLLHAPFTDYWAGLFAIDHWRINDRFTLEGQARVDYYSGTGADWSGRLAALYALDEQQRHVLRLAGAKSFRAMMPGIREMIAERDVAPSPPFPPDTPVVVFLPPGDVDNEQIYALEAGYTGRLNDQLTLRADAYLQRYEDLVGYYLLSISPPVMLDLSNQGGADAYGIDTSLEWTLPQGSVTLWYSYNGFDLDHTGQDTRSFTPAAHKLGVNLLWRLPEDFVFAANYKFSTACDTYSIPGQSAPTQEYHRLDLTLSKRICQGRGEVMIGVSDVFDHADFAVQPLTTSNPHETPGRTFFGRVQIRF
ncbi:MAG: TonB-dependent receptor [Phycisphaeraceae bacterium]|nr:TonB-dependent receptor [Phycisphaeraceae bacterium]